MASGRCQGAIDTRCRRKRLLCQQCLYDGAVDPVGEAADGRRKAIEAIRAMTDPEAAYHAATALERDQQAGRGEAAELKRELVRAIWESREMSLAGLAKITRTSRQRAHQLLQDPEGDQP